MKLRGIKGIALVGLASLLLMASGAAIVAIAAMGGEQTECTPPPPECTLPPPVLYFGLVPLYDFPSDRLGRFAYFPYYDPTAEVKDIKLEFTIPGTVFELGEEIAVEMWLTNTGNRPIRICFGDPLAWVVFEDERGLKWIPARGLRAILTIRDLAPNESISRKERIILQAGCPIERIVPRYTLEPGTYTLHVFADIAFSDPAADGTKRVRIWAPPVQIEIRESADTERKAKTKT